MVSRYAHSHSNARGSSYDRRSRREWMVTPAAGFGGDGHKVPCWECGAMVTVKTMYVDRIVSAEDGGTYRRDNIRPHCGVCSCRSGAKRTNELRKLTDPYDDTDHCKDCGAHFLASHPPSCRYLALVN